MKIPKFGTKNTLFGYLWAGYLRKYCHISKSKSWNLSNCRITVNKFGIKNALFGYFWAATIVTVEVSALKSVKILIFWTKNVWFLYFWAGSWKRFCHIWNQHPRICQKCVFSSYSKFWYRSVFSKVHGPFLQKVRLRFVKYAIKDLLKLRTASIFLFLKEFWRDVVTNTCFFGVYFVKCRWVY